jgi:DNA-binding CsgD family transcriptional regulator
MCGGYMQHQIKNHPVLLHAQDFIDLCSPLQKINITTFSHARFNQQNEFSLLSNNPDFLINYTDKKYYNVDIHTNIGNFQDMKFLMWDLIECEGQTHNMLKDASELNFKHIFTIAEYNEQGSDFYHFGTNVSTLSICQNYMNNLDLFKAYIQYFNQKLRGCKILRAAHDIKFKVDNTEVKPLVHKDEQLLLITDHEKQDFMQAIATDKIKLSKRQLQCAQLLIRGATTKEIAEKIFLSPRTVEEYIGSLKDKFFVRNKAELLVALLNYFKSGS